MPGIFVRYHIDTLSRDRDLLIAFDGRIDNRAEICGYTGAPDSASDEQLALAAYQLWGDNCASRILGDFAFVVRDDRLGRILAVRDPIGIKPLYYHFDGKVLLAASELHQVVKSLDGPCEINEGMAAEYLACGLSNNTETLWRGVFRLPPGHSLTVLANRRLTIRRYFDIDPGKTIRYKDDGEYACHFLHLLREAIQCRATVPEKTGILLSGGVDSSTIAATAASLRCAKAGTFSLVFPGLACDESSYIRQVNERWKLASHQFEPREYSVSFYADQARRYADFPDYPNGAMCHGLRYLARAEGVEVLLTGLGGDEWLMGSHYHYADLMRRFRLGELWSEAQGRAAAAGRQPSIRQIARFGMWPLLPGAIRRPVEARIHGGLVPDWIDRGFARRTCLEDRLRARDDGFRAASHAQADIRGVLTSPWRAHALELEDRATRAAGIEQRHPLSDRRIVEFALALPEQQRWRGNQTKFVQREAMRSLVPESIRLRRTKAEFSPVFMKTFQSSGGVHLFDQRRLVPGWINQPAVVSKYKAMEQLYQDGNPGYTRHSCPLWMILGLDLWRQGISSTEAAATSTEMAAM